MANRPVPPVFLEPKEIISHWSIMEFVFEGSPEKSRHLVGFVPSKMTMRVTTEIKYFDVEKLQVITSSGRLYDLKGSSDSFKEIEHGLSDWLRSNNVISLLNVTHQYIRTH